MNESVVDQWRESLSEREQKELLLADFYANKCDHGTPGHVRLMLIAKLASLIDSLTQGCHAT